MKIDLYLLNCYPLNPSILQMISFVNSTCLKISKIMTDVLKAGHVTLCQNWIDEDEFTPWVILYQYNFSSSDQLNISLVQYDTHLFLVIFPLALQFSQIFIFRSHRDNFIKFLKIITVSFFLVNNSRQFCTKYFCSQKRRCPVKSPEGDTKLEKSHQ